MATGKMTIHNHNVYYKASELGVNDHYISEGIEHLVGMGTDVAKAFFKQAKSQSQVEFKDRHGRGFILEYHNDGTYHLSGLN
jgi:hypothetical protein